MLNELSKKAYQNAVDKGFYENGKGRNIGEKLMLMVSELAEGLEADRHSSYCKHNMDSVNAIEDDEEFVKHYKEAVKGTFEEEMADIIIRVLDMCGYKNIDIDAHVLAKMRFNSHREKYHGKNY